MMRSLEAPLQITSIATLLAWPLLVGVGVVVWARTRAHARRVTSIESELQGLYQTLEARPLPSRLTMVVEALEEGEELNPARPSGKVATPAES